MTGGDSEGRKKMRMKKRGRVQDVKYEKQVNKA